MSEYPTWWKVLNIEDTKFERSQFASDAGPGKFRLKDLDLLRKVAPSIYEAATQEVREDNEYIAQEGKKFQKLRIGRKLGSIPLLDAGLNPELMHDKKAQDRYWENHPEMRAARPK